MACFAENNEHASIAIHFDDRMAWQYQRLQKTALLAAARGLKLRPLVDRTLAIVRDMWLVIGPANTLR
jgi:hypothetical protein